MDTIRKCIFCLQHSEPTSEWEIPWSIHCAQSLQKLLDLEPFTSSFFEAAEYCRKCKGVMRDVDFMSRSISGLEGRLSQFRQRIAKMLLDNFQGWRPTTELECDVGGDSGIRDAMADSHVCNGHTSIRVLKTLDEDVPHAAPNDYIKLEKYEEDSVVDPLTDPGFTSPSTRPEQERMAFVRLLKIPFVPHATSIRCTSLEDGEESDETQLIDDDGVANSGEFMCDFPGCNKHFLRSYHLDCHKPTHIGWRAYKCAVPSCLAAFTRKQHLVRHTNRDHRKCSSSTSVEVDRGDGGVGNSGEFICDFPGCQKRFSRSYPLDCHKPTHIGWRGYKCTVPSCSATFTRKQHLVKHTNRGHSKPEHSTRKVTDTDDEPIRQQPHVPDGVTPPEPELPVLTEESVGVEVGQTEESAGRRSMRLASRPQKRPLPIEEESEEDGMESDKSDFRVSGNESESDEADEKREEEINEKMREKKTKNPTKLSNSEAWSDRHVRFKCQNERLIPFVLSNYAAGVCRQLGEDTSKAGEFPSWESLLGTLESPQNINMPEETFEATFCFLFKKTLEDAEKGKRYGCTVAGCHRGFGDYAACERHALEIHGQVLDSFQCFLCDSRFPAGVHLDSHISKMHGGETHPFLCPVPLCSTQHKYKFKLNKHMAARHPEFQYDEEKREPRLFKDRDRALQKRKKTNIETLHCAEEGCTYRTLYPKYMKAHRIKSHGQDHGSLPYECETCGAGFKMVSTYKHHRTRAHLNRDEKLCCEFCGQSFVKRNELTSHIRWRHFEIATKFNCKICSRAYFSVEDCELHEEHHSKVPPFTCVLGCGPEMKRCGSGEELVRHVQGYHDEKKVVCHVCGFAITGPAANPRMKNHMRSHTREKTLKCRFCPKIFLHTSEQSTHEQIKHKDETKKEYKCGECGEVFGVYLYYYRHRRNKHGSNPIPRFQRKKVTNE